MTRAVPLLLLGLLVAGCARADAPPRLTVVVVVDHMPERFLARFGPHWDGGLARLLREGRQYTDAMHGHALTATSPGHASLATGVFPRTHGVVDNYWHEPGEGRVRFGEDKQQALLATRSGRGGSPHQLRATGLSDWLQAASPASEVHAVAWKQRSAVATGGRQPDGAWWWSKGEFVTSPHYVDDLPAWVRQWNARDPQAHFAGRHWYPSRPALIEQLAREDDFPFESDEYGRRFPHPFGERGWDVEATPFADSLTLDFARELVEHEGLGTDDSPDLLWVALAAGDEVGHPYGPQSWEVADHFLRLDGWLGDFLDALERRVGRDRLLVVLTSDHGTSEIPESAARRGEPVRRIQRDAFRALVDSVLVAVAGPGGPALVERLGAEGLWIDEAALPGGPHALCGTLEPALEALPGFARAYASCALEERPTDPGDPYRELYWRNNAEGRAPHWLFRFEPGWLVGSYDDGTDHGSAHEYDRRVPLLFWGAGVAAGRDDARALTVDLAPTLAARLGVPVPVRVDGRALSIGEDTP